MTFDEAGDTMKAKRKRPSVILENGKPTAVILDIKEYQEMLERLEDFEDLKALEEMRKKPLRFRDFEDFIQEYAPGI
ncbi:MAG TPA: type II toxin-antitoxin system Phd/YefM family antitoxin [Dehalococcoidia bacterium]|nr:type II toxin-antitoxin system Phd/YefM family antitoxin [Dehalococcoidia bacterium]